MAELLSRSCIDNILKIESVIYNVELSVFVLFRNSRLSTNEGFWFELTKSLSTTFNIMTSSMLLFRPYKGKKTLDSKTLMSFLTRVCLLN